jgi:hypothetical protein
VILAPFQSLVNAPLAPRRRVCIPKDKDHTLGVFEVMGVCSVITYGILCEAEHNIRVQNAPHHSQQGGVTMFLLVIGMLSMLLAGCATKPIEQQHVWIHPAGKSNEEFAQDRSQCLQESQQAPGTYVVGMQNSPMMSSQGVMSSMDDEMRTQTNDGVFNECMLAKGYTLVSEKNAPIASGSKEVSGSADSSQKTMPLKIFPPQYQQ